MIKRVTVIILMALVLALTIIGMALSAKNKAGADYQSPEGTTMRTPDILAAFSLLGNILGIIAAIIGFSIAFGHRWHPVIIGGWVFLAAVSIWFLGGGVALMSRQLNTLTANPDIWNAELAFNVVSSFFLMVTAAALISTLGVPALIKR